MKKRVSIIIAIILSIALCGNVFAVRISYNDIVGSNQKTVTEEKKESKKTQEITEQQKKAQQEAVAQQQAIAQQQAQQAALIAQQQAILAQQQAIENQPVSVLNIETNGQVGWINHKNAWYYIDKTTQQPYINRFLEENQKTYYFDENGIMQTSWKNINGFYYFFEKDGNMARGKWIQEMGKYYYLNMDGTMQTKDEMIDGVYCYFHEDGRWIENPAQELTEALGQKIIWCDDNTKKKKVDPSEEQIQVVKNIIQLIPTPLRTQLENKVNKIYICLDDADGKCVSKSYRDKDEGVSDSVDVPFSYTGQCLYCIQPEYLPFAIGAFVDKEYKMQGADASKSERWKGFFAHSTELEEGELDFDDPAHAFEENEELLFDSCVAAYIVKRGNLATNYPTAYTFIEGIL